MPTTGVTFLGSVRIKAIAVGLAIAVIGGAAYGVVVSLLIYWLGGWASGRPMQELVALRGGPLLTALSLIGVAALNGVAGYVTARMSAPRHLAEPLIVGLVLVVGDVIGLIVKPGAGALWVSVLLLVLIVPTILVGALIGWGRAHN